MIFTAPIQPRLDLYNGPAYTFKEALLLVGWPPNPRPYIGPTYTFKDALLLVGWGTWKGLSADKGKQKKKKKGAL